jgi:hypothetical protein
VGVTGEVRGGGRRFGVVDTSGDSVEPRYGSGSEKSQLPSLHWCAMRRGFRTTRVMMVGWKWSRVEIELTKWKV